MPADAPPTRIGVVGCGVVATAYYLPVVMDHPHATLAAVCDLDQARVDACVRLFGAEKGYTDYTAMLDDAELDAVLILTAPGTHLAFSLAAIERGIHLLIQKPMALDLAGADAITKAVREAELVCVVEPSDHTLLDPQYRQVREIIDRGVLGRPYWFQYIDTAGTEYHAMLGGNPYGNAAFYAADSGGMLFDFPYAPCRIVTCLGSCKSVTGNAKLSIPERKIVPDDGYTDFLAQCTDPSDCNYWEVVLGMEKSQTITAGAPDNVFSNYELDSGWIGTFHIGRPFHPLPKDGTGGGNLRIFGEAGNLIFGAGANFASFITERKDLLPEAGDDGWYHLTVLGDFEKAQWPKPVPGAFDYYAESTRHLIDCIRNGKDPIVNVEFGRHITEMMWGALESSRTGRRYDMTTTTTGVRDA
ncbi:MAG: Gfo/Idh/MocA family oxidoreductase [Planctomycetota bacterium]